MKLLSDACEYGLRAVVWLAQQPDKTQKMREIAEAIHAPPGYLVKVLQLLTRAGIVSAKRGSTGGFTLEHSPEGLSVLDIMNAIDPFERIRTCPLRLHAHVCNLCRMHQRIDDAMAAIEAGFAASTIADLLASPSPSQPLCDHLLTLDLDRESDDDQP